MNTPKTSSGFTLVEIMIVVVIIGLLTAIAIPGIKKAVENSQNAQLAKEFSVFSDAIEIYALENGEFPEDSSTGQIPAGLEEYISDQQWLDGSVIGGSWDVEFNDSGITSAVGIHNYTVDSDRLEQFDAVVDDGRLDSGQYRIINTGRYYYVVAE